MKPWKSTKMVVVGFMGRLIGGLIVATFWGIFLPIQILWVVYKLSQAKKQASTLKENENIANKY